MGSQVRGQPHRCLSISPDHLPAICFLSCSLRTPRFALAFPEGSSEGSWEDAIKGCFSWCRRRRLAKQLTPVPYGEAWFLPQHSANGSFLEVQSWAPGKGALAPCALDRLSHDRRHRSTFLFSILYGNDILPQASRQASRILPSPHPAAGTIVSGHRDGPGPQMRLCWTEEGTRQPRGHSRGPKRGPGRCTISTLCAQARPAP